MGWFERLKGWIAGAPDGVRRVEEVRPGPGQSRRQEPESPRLFEQRPERKRGAFPSPGSQGLPHLAGVEDLAEAMGLTVGRLMWLADPTRTAAAGKYAGPHYRLLVRHKRAHRGRRYLLAPKSSLKQAQRWVLRNVLDPLETGPCAHGFVRGRSIVTHARHHIGRDVIVRIDVQDFFHAFSLRRVRGFLRTTGYDESVVRILALLCTAPVRQMMGKLSREAGVPEREALDAMRSGPRKGAHPILPQGAPTSPALANLICRRLDRRMAGLARAFGATYTRYADDLTFSGGKDLRRDLRSFLKCTTRILEEEGLKPAQPKLQVRRRGNRQQICGLVVNERLNVPATERRLLRAILHNCVRSGPSTQNSAQVDDLRAHLRGRIEFVRAANPQQGERLLEQFARVDWSR